PPRGCRTGCAGWMIIPLNQTFLSQHLFPELVARHFSGLDYDVAVVAGQKGERVIYSSDPKANGKFIADADPSMSLFGFPSSPNPLEMGLPALPRLKGVTDDVKYASAQRIFGGEEGMELHPMPGVSPLDGWQLVVNNRQGSLEAAVEALRRRNLAMSF